MANRGQGKNLQKLLKFEFSPKRLFNRYVTTLDENLCLCTQGAHAFMLQKNLNVSFLIHVNTYTNIWYWQVNYVLTNHKEDKDYLLLLAVWFSDALKFWLFRWNTIPFHRNFWCSWFLWHLLEIWILFLCMICK